MIWKTLYSSPDLKIRDLRNRGLLCVSINKIGYSNEDLTEDGVENEYDE